MDDSLARAYKVKKREVFQFLCKLIKVLQFPTKILQGCFYYYQRFYMFNSFAKYGNAHYDVGITALFISLKQNDYIKKLSLVISEAYKLRGIAATPQEQDEHRKRLLSMEKKFMELEAFDFRYFLIEELLIKYAKYFRVPREVCFLSWSMLNDLYATELPLQWPSNFNAIVVLRTSLLVWNELNLERKVERLLNEREVAVHARKDEVNNANRQQTYHKRRDSQHQNRIASGRQTQRLADASESGRRPFLQIARLRRGQDWLGQVSVQQKKVLGRSEPVRKRKGEVFPAKGCGAQTGSDTARLEELQSAAACPWSAKQPLSTSASQLLLPVQQPCSPAKNFQKKLSAQLQPESQTQAGKTV
ncbi:hypothetical protein KL942_003754 [Ogataea angusta]|nr:hypothetical protein KL942_003754 [Ogataea angusta]